MRESRMSGSARGARSNPRPYRDLSRSSSGMIASELVAVIATRAE